ncbi:MAG: T9SS type A sorting domain-containing protein [Lewinellaceae bacterium]|nr:T9SS type A sorting domain-containing protein [Lewinellaceae bacterium]
MKKSNFYKKQLMLAIASALVCIQIHAQTNVNMAANGTTAGSPFTINPPATCFFNFYDSGGPAGSYNSNANANVTFLPSNPATHRIQVSFTSYSVESDWDAFYIFNSDVVGTNMVPGPGPVNYNLFPAGHFPTTPGTITANTGLAAVGANANEALTFQLRSDAATQFSGWSAIVRQVPKDACALDAPGNLTANTGPGNTSCFANVTTELPEFAPVGCNTGYQLQYRINGGMATIVNNTGFTTISTPVGANVITWELVDPCGGGVISSDNQTITVTDNTNPVLNCPGDVTLTLAPGQCSVDYNYSVTCTDNCPFTASGSVAHPIDFNSAQAGVMFDVRNLGTTPMTITSFSPSLNAGTWQMEVYYTTIANSWQSNANNPAAWTLAGTRTVTSALPGAGTPITGFNIVLAPGQSKGIYLTSTSGAPLNYTEGNRQFDNGQLRVSSNPGAGKQYAFGATFNDRSYNGSVGYFSEVVSTPLQTGGLVTNSPYTVGETINSFYCEDAAGNEAICSFKVTVVPYPDPIDGILCNDLVNFSLGEGCLDELLPDQVLEGGPYSCYDNYLVELDKIPPYGNGPWVPALLGAADIGKTYRVRVTDQITLNKCYGDVKVFDNVPPELECNVLTVPANYPLLPTFSQVTEATIKFSVPNLPIFVTDFQTRTFSIPVSGPAGATVTDVDFATKISQDAFFGNLEIEIESPSGTIVKVCDQMTGCGASPIWARFDDEGANTMTCPALTTNQKVRIPNGIGSLSSFDGQPVNGNWIVRIADVNGGTDISKIEAADLFVRMTGNFSVGFPNGLTAPPLTALPNNRYLVPAGLLDECSDVTLSYTDMSTPQLCESGLTAIVLRTWQAVDVAGNTATCIQTINLLRPLVEDYMFPPNYDDFDEPSFSCVDGAYPTPQWIESQGFQGFPTVFGLPPGGLVTFQHMDAVTRLCDGSYNITRTWTASDNCSNTVVIHIQYIRVRDQTGPVISCPTEVQTTTDPFSCCATVNLPDVIVEDGCSRINSIRAEIEIVDPVTQTIINTVVLNGTLTSFPGNNTNDRDTLAVFGNTACLPIGTHIVSYIAIDNCGNQSACTFELQINDYSPPVASCTEFTVVAIGIDDPTDCYEPSANGCDFAGVTVVPATSFDQGSYDNCGEVGFTVRRVPPYSSCITDLNECEYEVATAENDSIKFYCCEVGTIQDIILRVYQLDALGQITYYPDGTPIYNECLIKVEVQDKLKPVCDPPLNLTVSCENFDPSLWAYGKASVYDNCCLDSTKMYQGQKGLTHSANYSQFDTVCNRGTITRTFRAYDCRGFSSSCTQKITVTYDQKFGIKFPDDVVINTCNGNGIYGEPTFYGEDCELLAVAYHDQIFTVVTDACYKIERTWTVINWCNYSPESLCTLVLNPTPNSNPGAPQNNTGPIVSAPGTPAPWTATVTKINPTDETTTNYSSFWNANTSCYKYKQIIKIIDNADPILVCPATDTICDVTNNNPNLWNEPYWYDTNNEMHDLCEAPTDLHISATDLCSGANLNVRYILFLDLDGDGVMETAVSSTNVPQEGTVRYGNANTTNFGGGTVRTFDERAVAANQKYRFALQTSVVDGSLTAAVRWNTLGSPGSYVLPELPHGVHKIKWIVEDGCGNESVCEYTFVIRDCKKPTIFCQGGWGVTNMQTGMITLFASDFLLHAEDNCTPEENLEFAIQVAGGPLQFPTDNNGNPIISITFDCSDIGTQMVQLWAIDQAGNADYCTATITIQDPLNICGGTQTQASVAGILKTENDNGLEECDVELSGQAPNGAAFNQFVMTDQEGHYQFNNAVPMLSDYTLTPTKDNNPLNGVTTYDLVLISKHILGLEPLNTPYKMIAADANRSGSVTTFDIVELRKLILGIYEDLPNNTSWRFVDGSYQFANPANPFQSVFPENKTVSNIQANQMSDNMVAIKIGDVNSSVIANSLMNADERSSGALIFDVSTQATQRNDGTVKAGETFEVTLTATEKVQGYQFTMNFQDLELIDLKPGADMKSDNFAVFADDNALTTSWDGEGETNFTLRFKARKAGEISKMLAVSSRITKAEAYTADGERLDIAFRFNGKDGETVTGIGFELYQNVPNPFMNKTVIGFHLPEDTDATLNIFDESGRMVYSQKGSFAKGYNAFPIERAMVNVNGVLYYTLQTDTDSATRKMIQIK